MIEKLRMQTPNGADEKFRLLSELFPNAVTETLDDDGKPVRAIDKDILAQEINAHVLEGREERYQFTWPEKSKAIAIANERTSMCLRPCENESVDFDTTENLYIEGDNLKVLKILRESYLGKVKMIYIDPPYNTGKDFVYRDNFAMDGKEYKENSGQYDEDGNRLVQNVESNGRFHTDWLNMMYSRLKIAREFLTEDGVIFISIDDNEVVNLKKICDEIFNETNFLAQIVVEGTPKSDPYVVSTAHEYCLVYTKNINYVKTWDYGMTNPLFVELLEIYSSNEGNYKIIESKLKEFYKNNNLQSENISNYKYADKDGIFRIGPIDDPQGGGAHDDRINPKTGNKCMVPSSGWRCNRQTWDEWIKNNLIDFPDEDNKLPSKKTYITSDRLDVMRAYFKIQTRRDTENLRRLFNTKVTPFSNPKPVQLIRTFVENCNDKNMIVLDFFSGSGTTMHAVFLQNLRDNGKRKCILIQLPEDIIVSSSQGNKEKKIAKEAISLLESIGVSAKVTELAKERLRREAKKIREEMGDKAQGVDMGFRVLKCDSSNMEEVYYTPAELVMNPGLFKEDNVKPGRTAMDLLFQIMPELNIPLSAKIAKVSIGGRIMFSVNDGYLLAALDGELSEAAMRAAAAEHPVYFVTRDSALANDAAAANLEQIFKSTSGESILRVL